jgi:hypothetical protein
MHTLRIAHNTPRAQRAEAEAFLASLPSTTFANVTLASAALCRAPRAL